MANDDLSGANLREASVHRAHLQAAILIDTDFSGTELTGCRIVAVSAGRLKLDGVKQQNLVVVGADEPDHRRQN
jgi:uncharacterized protein YjbI with pentapeptide repeats